jgi:hypothetical protein
MAVTLPPFKNFVQQFQPEDPQDDVSLPTDTYFLQQEVILFESLKRF